MASSEWKNTSLTCETDRWTRQTIPCLSRGMVRSVQRDRERREGVRATAPPRQGRAGQDCGGSRGTGQAGGSARGTFHGKRPRSAELLGAWARPISLKQNPPNTCIAPRLQPWLRVYQRRHLGKQLGSPGSIAWSLNWGQCQALRAGLWCRWKGVTSVSSSMLCQAEGKCSEPLLCLQSFPKALPPPLRRCPLSFLPSPLHLPPSALAPSMTFVTTVCWGSP